MVVRRGPAKSRASLAQTGIVKAAVRYGGLFTRRIFGIILGQAEEDNRHSRLPSRGSWNGLK